MKSALVVGGGLAGISAAVRLAERGVRVTLLESKPRLGGRAGSFVDPASGQVVDACQHVSMGCCTAYAKLCETVGVRHLLAPQPVLYFVTPDRRVSRFAADPWPAPFHLGRALMCAHYLSAGEKLRIVYGLGRLLLLPAERDEPLEPFLRWHAQTDRTLARYWGVVLTSALNESVSRVGTRYARKVFLDGFVRDRTGFVVEVPAVPLDRLYGEELRGWLDRHGVTLKLNAGVKRVEVGGGRATGVTLRDGTAATADAVVLAVPFGRVADLLPPELAAVEPFSHAAKLAPSPITSVHLWLDRPTMRLPHAVLVDCLGQWVFDRGQVAPGEWYLQVVVSASGGLAKLGRDEVQRRVVGELGRLFPAVAAAKLLRAKVVTEHAATFSAVPGVDRFRPDQRTPIPNLALAGDWTATGWPATMEGAVRSGELAAAALTGG